MMRRAMILVGTLASVGCLVGLGTQGCTVTSGTVDGGGLSSDSGTSSGDGAPRCGVRTLTS